MVNAEYAVRGVVPTRAAQIKEQLSIQGHTYPFNEMTELNVGNPLALGQLPMKYNRQVMSCIICPELLDKKVFHVDVENRARFFLKEIGPNVGAYSESMGYKFVRKIVTEYIARRDEMPVDPNAINNIFLTDGAS